LFRTPRAFFGQALRKILAEPGLARDLRQIIVCRDWGKTAFALELDGAPCESRFADTASHASSQLAKRRGTLFSLARLGGTAVSKIADVLARPGH